MTSIMITHHTDPGCPLAWSAEPARRRLQRLYGDCAEPIGADGRRALLPVLP
jgi:hypothetical protein